jgi:hypothetical protein
MFEFMMLQVIAIALIIIFPSIAVWFPQVLQEEARAMRTEEVDDSQHRLEEDPLQGLGQQEQQEEEQQEGEEEQDSGESLEQDELVKPKK